MRQRAANPVLAGNCGRFILPSSALSSSGLATRAEGLPAPRMMAMTTNTPPAQRQRASSLRPITEKLPLVHYGSQLPAVVDADSKGLVVIYW